MKTNNLPKPPRQRTSVAIQGLDRSTPDDLVADGKCQELHNLRYKDNAWRPIHPHKVKTRFDNMPAPFTVVYHHPTADKYIVEEAEDGLYNYYALIDPEANYQEALAIIASFDAQQEVSHFGNLLFFNADNKTAYFLYENGSYIPFVAPPYAKTEVTSQTSSTSPLVVLKNGDESTSWIDAKDLGVSQIVGGEYRASWFPIFNYTQGVSMIPQSEGAWSGEILLFTTWRMQDGTNLSPSPLHLVKSAGAYSVRAGITRTIGRGVNPKEFWERRNLGQSVDDLDSFLYIQYTLPTHTEADGDNKVPLGEPSIRKITPTLRIRVPADVDISSVKSLAVWSTRVNPIYHSDRVFAPSTDNWRHTLAMSSNIFLDYYADNDLANQQFYLVKEFEIKEFKNETAIHPDTLQEYNTGYKFLELILTYTLLEQVIYNTKYTPSNNIHNISSQATLDYNNRLHSANLLTRLYEGYHIGDSDIADSGDVETKYNEWVTLDIENRRYNVVTSSSKHGVAIKEGTPFERVVSYPDYRALRYSADSHGTMPLREAPANNVAWYHAPHTELEKYPPIAWDERVDFENTPANDDTVLSSNRLIVSEPNNPLNISFDAASSFGSNNNRIIAIQSGAIETHEMKVGELPLYVFTDEGIFALIAGSSTLYSSVAAINYDKVINPNTLAINGAIVYITEKGVHLLTSAGSQIISAPIHDINGMPPLNFLRRCKIIHPKQYNEIVLLNDVDNDGTAYVYNLDSGYWSTRELSGVKLNTNELYRGNTIYDLNDENENSVIDARIVTRAIKLGNVEFKRLETIAPRMQLDGAELEIGVYGSNFPMSEWSLLREMDYNVYAPLILRRTPFSAKYFQFSLLKYFHRVFSISHIDFEWYARFVHRMR